ncbi:MAG: sn-glycerol-3-phosphate ABC transporter permease UgpE [Alcaligenaceae bacterium]|nr:sn-glycerol-3-phosphate ABC transporter permease UgpE [Alcaligenaceae bacterium]
MVERRPFLDFLAHVILIIGLIAIIFPLYVAFVASTQTAQEAAQAPISLVPGLHFIENYRLALFDGTTPVFHMLLVSLALALFISIGKISISMISAFAIVYFKFPFKKTIFWMIFITLMLPVEVRISPTIEIVTNLGLSNSFMGMTLPLIASATATFLFRQFFMTIPDELVEAARIDGAGPMRFFKDILYPLSKTTIAALFVIQFIYGWNQYLWPLISNSDESLTPIVVGIKSMIGGGDTFIEWNVVMATALLAMLPPGIVVVLMQKSFVKGLIETEK